MKGFFSTVPSSKVEETFHSINLEQIFGPGADITSIYLGIKRSWNTNYFGLTLREVYKKVKTPALNTLAIGHRVGRKVLVKDELDKNWPRSLAQTFV